MPISGKEAIKRLERLGFQVSRQHGSHVVLYKLTEDGKRVAVVPQHKELKKGTLRSIASQAGIEPSILGV